MAQAGLTVRRTCRTDAKAGHNEPMVRIRCGQRLSNKSYSGDGHWNKCLVVLLRSNTEKVWLITVNRERSFRAKKSPVFDSQEYRGKLTDSSHKSKIKSQNW